MPRISHKQQQELDFLVQISAIFFAILNWRGSLLTYGILYCFLPDILNKIKAFFMSAEYVYGEMIGHDHDFHKKMILCVKSLGYPYSKAGICYGFTMRWIEAVLTNTTSEFLLRTTHIIKLYNNQELTKQELLDVRAFFESLLLYQSSEISSEILNKEVCQRDTLEISEFASSTKMIEAGGFVITDSLHIGHFDSESIRQALNIIVQAAQQSHYEDKIPLLITLIDSKQYTGHTVCLTYNPANNGWQSMDVNSYPPKTESDFLEASQQLPFTKFYSYSIRAVLPTNAVDLKKLLIQIPLTLGKSNDDELLYLAVTEGHVAAVQELLNHGVNPNQMIQGFTLLSMAVTLGKISIVQELIKRKADPNQKNSDGVTPLLIASQLGNLAIVQTLLNAKADPLQTTPEGLTALDVALESGHLVVARVLSKGNLTSGYKNEDKKTWR